MFSSRVLLLSIIVSAVVCVPIMSTANYKSFELSKPNKDLIRFVVNLVNRHFSNCSMLLVQDNTVPNEKEHGDSATSALEDIKISTKYVINFHNATTDHSTLTRAARTSSKKDYSSSIGYAEENAAHLPVSYLPLKYSSIRRHTEECMITTLWISQHSPEFMSQVRDVISPNFLPVTKKDKDHYIFITEPSAHKEVLGMEMWVSKIKFKIAIGIEDDEGNMGLRISTMDFFGGPNATPQLVDMSRDKDPENIHNIFPDFTWNLRGYTLQVTIPYSFSLVEVIHSPHNNWEGINNAKRGRWKYVLEAYLMLKYNFTYRMFPATGVNGRFGGGGTGVELKNGTWIGVTGDLYYGKADLGLGIANTDKRTFFIAFTDSMWDLGQMTFVTGQPTKVYSTLAILWPFNVTVWLCILVTTVLAMGFFYMVTKFMIRLHMEEEAMSTWNTQILLIVAPFVEQDSPIQPISHPLRSFCALWAFYIMIVTCLYRSKLVTLLAFPVLSKIPKDFEELAFSDFDVGFMKVGDASYNTFTRSNNAIYKTLVGRWEVIPGVNLTCMEKVVRRGQYACILYDFDVVYLQQRNLTDVEGRKMKYTSSKTYNAWIALALQPHSIYRINFGITLGQSVPFHLCQVWIDMDLYDNVRIPKFQWWLETNNSHLYEKEVASEGEDELTLNNIKGVFYVFLSCLLVSMVAFCKEVATCPSCFKNRTKTIKKLK